MMKALLSLLCFAVACAFTGSNFTSLEQCSSDLPLGALRYEFDVSKPTVEACGLSSLSSDDVRPFILAPNDSTATSGSFSTDLVDEADDRMCVFEGELVVYVHLLQDILEPTGGVFTVIYNGDTDVRISFNYEPENDLSFHGGSSPGSLSGVVGQSFNELVWSYYGMRSLKLCKLGMGGEPPSLRLKQVKNPCLQPDRGTLTVAYDLSIVSMNKLPSSLEGMHKYYVESESECSGVPDNPELVVELIILPASTPTTTLASVSSTSVVTGVSEAVTPSVAATPSPTVRPPTGHNIGMIAGICAAGLGLLVVLVLVVAVSILVCRVRFKRCRSSQVHERYNHWRMGHHRSPTLSAKSSDNQYTEQFDMAIRPTAEPGAGDKERLVEEGAPHPTVDGTTINSKTREIAVVSEEEHISVAEELANLQNCSLRPLFSPEETDRSITEWSLRVAETLALETCERLYVMWSGSLECLAEGKCAAGVEGQERHVPLWHIVRELCARPIVKDKLVFVQFMKDSSGFTHDFCWIRMQEQATPSDSAGHIYSKVQEYYSERQGMSDGGSSLSETRHEEIMNTMSQVSAKMDMVIKQQELQGGDTKEIKAMSIQIVDTATENASSQHYSLPDST